MRAVDDGLTLLGVDGASVPTASVAQVRVGRVGRDESVGLGGDGREDAFLVEAGTVCAASVWRRVEAVASDLVPVREGRANRHDTGMAYLSPSAISTCNCRSLPWCWLIEAHLSVLRVVAWVVRTWLIWMLRMPLVHVVGRSGMIHVGMLLGLRWRESNHFARL